MAVGEPLRRWRLAAQEQRNRQQESRQES